MKKWLLLWAVCGLYSWGTMMAYSHYRDTHDWAILNDGARDNVGICTFVSLGGPAGAIVVAFITNFNQHGWELWWHR